MTPFDVRIAMRLGPELGAEYSHAPAFQYAPRPRSGLAAVTVFGNATGPHWHYVATRSQCQGAGARLSFRLHGPDVSEPGRAPEWPLSLLAAFASHARSTGRPPARGHYLCMPEPVDVEGGVRAAVLIRDPSLADCLQAVLLQPQELDRVSGERYAEVLEALEALPLAISEEPGRRRT